jgi:16S rRNA (cytosine1402-N4)-methyltransferase
MDYDYHVPVLKNEVLEYLVTDKDGIYIDATLGGGGHTEEILNTLSDKGKVIGFDCDVDAINHVKTRFEKNSSLKDRFYLINSNFVDLKKSLIENNLENKISGILFDLGVSSFQFDNVEKGFTYKEDTILDMRMDKNRGREAFNILNSYSALNLEKIFRDYAEDKNARTLAKSIVAKRKEKEFKTSLDFVNFIKSFVGDYRLNKVLSRLFQALRIETNNELENLSAALVQSDEVLSLKGRLAVIAYHSLEDRIIKNYFREEAKTCICPPSFPQCVCNKKASLKIITPHPVIPMPNEVESNIRARSAKLRVAERI